MTRGKGRTHLYGAPIFVALPRKISRETRYLIFLRLFVFALSSLDVLVERRAMISHETPCIRATPRYVQLDESIAEITSGRVGDVEGA
jgi:hypothetical protein